MSPYELTKRPALVVPAVSIGAGVLSWVATVIWVKDADVMGHAEYLLVGFPFLLLVSGVLGWIYGPKAWHCGLWMMFTQLLIGFATVQSDFNLLPIGLVIFLILAGICTLPALIVGLLIRKRRTQTGKP